jgi:hypothetical protein
MPIIDTPGIMIAVPWLRSRGFKLVTSCGEVKKDYEEGDLIRIAGPDVVCENEIRFLWFRIKNNFVDVPIIAKIYFNCPKKGTQDKRWTMEVYGTANVAAMTALAAELEANFEVEIRVVHVSENPEMAYGYDEYDDED